MSTTLDATGTLFQSIFTHNTLGDNVNEIPFSSLVCLTGISVGAVPGVIRRDANSFINVFARDVRAPGAARFSCLYEGLQQPVAGTNSIPLQQFVTDHIVIRGRFQTAPITLHGFELVAVADECSVSPYPTLPTLDEGLFAKFCDLVPRIVNGKLDTTPGTQACEEGQNVSKETAASLLEELLVVWRACGANPRMLHAHPCMSIELVDKTIEIADTLCYQLSIDGFGASFSHISLQEVDEEAFDVQELIDMVMGWMGLLADVKTTFRDLGTNITMSRFGAIGLAASVLVCSCFKVAAEVFISRHGQLLLAEALDPKLGSEEDFRSLESTTLRLPTSQVRHAAATGLLIVKSAESWGCEALLGWWQPKFVQWTARKNVGQRKKREMMIPQVDGAADDRKRPRRDAREELEAIRRSKRREASRSTVPEVDHNDRFRSISREGVSDPRKDLRAVLDDKRRSRNNRSPGFARSSVEMGREEARREEARREEARREEARREEARREEARREEARREEARREEADYMHATSSHWDRRLKEFPGVYSPLVVAFTSLLTPTTTRLCAEFLNALRFYEHVTTFSTAAEKIVNDFSLWSSKDDAPMTAIDKQSYSRCGAAASAISKILGRGKLDTGLAFGLMSSRTVLPFIPPLLRVLQLVPSPPTLLGLCHLVMAILFGSKDDSSTLGLLVSHTGPQYLNELYKALKVHGASVEPLVFTFRGLCIGTVCIAESCDALVERPSDKASWSIPLFRLGLLLSASSETRNGLMYAATQCLDRFMPACWKALELRSRCGQAITAGTGDEDFVCLQGLEVRALDAVMDMLLSLTLEWAPVAAERLGNPHASTALTLLPQLSSPLLTSFSADAMATYSNITLLHGRFRALAVAGNADGTDLLKLLDSNLPSYDSSSFSFPPSSSTVTGSFSLPWTSVRSFWDEIDARGTVEACLCLLTTKLKSSVTGLTCARQVMAHRILSVHNDNENDTPPASGGTVLVMRALSVGMQVVRASQADASWQCRAGAAIDDAKSAASRRSAIDFLCAASEFADALLTALKTASVFPLSTPCLVNTLVDTYIVSSIDLDSLSLHQRDSRRMKRFKGAGGKLLQARQHLISALRCCIESGADLALSKKDLGKSKEPNVVGIILDHARSGPASVYAVVRCLGDLFPEVWPPPRRQSDGGAQRTVHLHSSIAPSRRRLRSAAAMAIEQRRLDFSELVTSCAASEVTLLRVEVTRMVGRAAGLGGGMGPFLMRSLVAALQGATTSLAPGRAVHTVMQTLLPLLYLPALKAASIDVGLALRLVALMKATDPSNNGTDDVINVNISGSAEELSSIVTMSLECLAVLCNPDIVLDRLAPQEVNESNEVLPVAQATAVAAYLFEGLPTLAGNAVLGARLLGLLASTRVGRLAMYQAIVSLHHTATLEGEDSGPKQVDASALVEAARWAAGVYRSLSEQAQQAEAPLLAQTFTDIVELLKGLCMTWEVDTGGRGAVTLETLVVTPPPAPERFVAATRAALSAERDDGSREGGVGNRQGLDLDVALNDSVGKGIDDDSVELFWRNHVARQVTTSPATVKLYGRWEVKDEACSVTSLLHPPLTHFLRPVFEKMDEYAMEELPGDPPPPPPPPGLISNGVLQPDRDMVEGRGTAANDKAILKSDKEESLFPPLDLDLYADLDVAGGIAIPRGPNDSKRPPLLETGDHEQAEEKDLNVNHGEKEEEIEDRGHERELVREEKDLDKSKGEEVLDEPTGRRDEEAEQFDVKELLSNPGAVQKLLEDPAKLQEMLERNPALLAVLKEKLAAPRGK